MPILQASLNIVNAHACLNPKIDETQKSRKFFLPNGTKMPKKL
jgi:hypothetical protein